MIHSFLSDKCKELAPDLQWSVNFFTAQDHTGTVYQEGGPQSDRYDIKTRHPQYQIFIRSSNLSRAYNAAEMIYQMMQSLQHVGETHTIEWREQGKGTVASQEVMIQSIFPLHSQPISLGVDPENTAIAQYSINVQANVTPGVLTKL